MLGYGRRKRLGLELQFPDFIAGGKWNVDDVLRPIYEQAGKMLGRDFPYPADAKKTEDE